MTHKHHGHHGASPALIAGHAVSVAEAWQRKSLGILLIGIVTSRAKALGAQYLVSDVFRSNRAMITLARKSR